MRALLVFPNYGTAPSFSPALQLISAILKREGVEVKLLHLHEKMGFPRDKELIQESIRRYIPHLVFFTSTSFEYKSTNEIAGWVREVTDALLLLGGFHAITVPQDLEASNFDGFCIGEGEIEIVELVNELAKDDSKIGYSKINSFHWKVWDDMGQMRIVANPRGRTVTNLDDLPDFDWDIFETQKLIDLRNGWISMQFSRGCIFNCTYCIHEDSIIETTEGPKKAKDIRVGDRVISSYPGTPRLSGNYIVSVREEEKELIEIELENGKTLKLTPDHMVKTDNKRWRGWKYTKDLTIEDKIAYISDEKINRAMTKNWRKSNFSPLAEKNSNWQGGKSQEYYRRIAFEKYGANCRYCHRVAMDVNHKDGDHSNNDIINLEPVCRRCHMKNDGRLYNFRKKDIKGDKNPRWNPRLH